MSQNFLNENGQNVQKWTVIFRRDTKLLSPKQNGQNGQNGQEMDSHFQEGYELFQEGKTDKNGQSFSGGIRTLLKTWNFGTHLASTGHVIFQLVEF